jgi:peptidoglycan/LPS O-acetylase OafA/YrhL
MTKEPVDFRISLAETNIIKGIAICAMLFHHLFFETDTYGFFTQQVAIICKVCVSMFLFVSGYGLAIQYSKQAKQISIPLKIICTIKFLLKRFRKFYLNYWVIFALLVPLGVFALGRPLSVAYGTETAIWQNLIKDIFGIQGGDSYIITWWFNALIISLYLLFPILYWLMGNGLIAIGALTLLLLWPRDYIVGNFFYIFELWNSNLIIFSFVFTFGIFAARHSDLLNKILNKIRAQAVLILSFFISVGLCFARQIWAECYADAITIDAFLTVFIALSVISFCRLTKLQIKPLALLGKHSMNIYLFHTFLLMYFFPKFMYGTNFPLLIFAALLGESLIISMLLEFAKKKLGFYKLYV